MPHTQNNTLNTNDIRNEDATLPNSIEAFDRNHILELIHNTHIPSYAQWEAPDVRKETIREKLHWWNDINQEYMDNKCQSDYERTVCKTTILKWVTHYERAVRDCEMLLLV